MTPEQHARSKELFLAACEQPKEQRARFLDQACGGDRQLRQHIDLLLQHHQDSGATVAALGPDSSTRDARDAADRQPDAGAVKHRLESGSVIADRYRIVALLGTGGMGAVYRAEDLVLAQTVALKFLPARFSTASGWLARFVNEARVARQITHSNVCRIFDIHVDETAAQVFISMEYVDGEDLRALLRRVGRLSRDKALQVAREICIGLTAAHAKGILHRDLKPANIMIDGTGHVRITDFGLAAPREAIAAQEIRSGTPGYMAPELFAGTDVSIRSDIYALGLVLYELFTGRPAYEGDSLTEYARLHQRSEPTPPIQLLPDLPPTIDRLIRQCLEKDPSDRPSSALAVAAALPDADPLALARSAGITPSPTFVAASGTSAGLSTKLATGLLAVFFAMLLVVVLLAGRAGIMPDLRAAKPASVLADRAQQLADELAPTDARPHRALGFSLRPAVDFLGGGQVTRGSPAAFASDTATELKFWYRQSPAPLTPVAAMSITFGRARTTLTDPPRTAPGMVALVLDAGGRLLGFESVPQRFSEDELPPVNWTPFFAAAGLDPQRCVAATPELEPWLPIDERAAWDSPGPGDSDDAVRVEAAALRGKPVHFSVLPEGAPAPATPRTRDPAWRTAVVMHTRIALLSFAALGAIPLAWRNVRRGQGDRRGAFRLAGAVLVGRVAAWGLSAARAGQVDAEFRLLLFALMCAWFEATLVWVFYVALEPYVRRFWPQTIVAWTRVLAGRWHDPLVARDLLVGMLLGTCIVLLFVLDHFALSWMKWDLREPLRLFYALDALLGARHSVAACIGVLLATIYLGLFFVTFLVIARMVLRRTWAAGLVTVATMLPVYLPGMAHPGWSSIPLLVVLTSLVWTAARLGLVVLLSAILVARLLLELPLGFVVGAVGWDLTVFVLIIVSGLAVYGFAYARRPGPASVASASAAFQS